MIERLLPASVVAVETFTDVSGEEPHPGEADLVSRAVEARRREFITARRCAREALSALGHHTVAIRSGQHREPIWPTGFVGSITHCAGYRGAAVARAGEPAAVGIDAEPHDSLPHAVARLIVGEQNAWLRELTQAAPATHWDRVLFSIKESAFKAWFPLTGRWLGFDDVVVSVVPNAGLFRAQVLIDGARIDGGPPLTQMQGRFIVDGGLVLTAAIVEA